MFIELTGLNYGKADYDGKPLESPISLAIRNIEEFQASVDDPRYSVVGMTSRESFLVKESYADLKKLLIDDEVSGLPNI